MSRQEKATLHPADGEEIEIKYQVVVNTNRTANQIRVCFHIVKLIGGGHRVPPAGLPIEQVLGVLTFVPS